MVDLALDGDAATGTRCTKDFYVVLDFKGWRYCELIEPETGRLMDFTWPGRPMLGGVYGIYRETSAADDQLSLFVNAVPSGGGVSCDVGAIKALPLVQTAMKNPSVMIGGKTVTFPVDMRSGQYLELRGPGDCLLYDVDGKVLRHVAPAGDLPDIAAGDNKLEISVQPAATHAPCAWRSRRCSRDRSCADRLA